MIFCEKLDYLMNTLKTTNKELGQAIHVDPSLISRWRTGKRRPAHNSSYIRSISKYFSELPMTDYQKISITASIGLPLSSWNQIENTFAENIYNWLYKQSTNDSDSVGAVDSFLAQVNIWQNPNNLKQSRISLLNNISSGKIKYTEVFKGKKGMKNAILKLISAAIYTTNSIHSIMILSDQGLDWFFDLSSDIDMEWTQLLQYSLAQYPTYLVFHTIIRNLQNILSTIENILPFYVAANINMLYCPQYFENPFQHIIICVSGVGAIVSHYIDGMDDETEYYLYLDSEQVKYYEKICHRYISKCKPLIQTFNASQIPQFYKFQQNFFLHNSPNISLLHTLSSTTMPKDVFYQSLQKLNINEIEHENALHMYNNKNQLFLNNLNYSKYTEIIMLPEINENSISSIPLNLSPYFCDQPLFYDNESFCKHIQNIIKLLNTYENYNVFLKHKKILDNIQIMVKEDLGVVFTKEYKPFLTFALTQPNMTIAFYNYLYNMCNTVPTQERCKKYVINQLSNYITLAGGKY